ncbi:hypothetical protein [Flavobacterium gelatinilyticum]|uniref:hypothetical protein n=1 Tax=Flavobacterium gelatinilyticum TaxID=3003260 RepID=UPI00247FC60F|nr:hypothetical protein [Flavobacterium gelatinilyticum]
MENQANEQKKKPGCIITLIIFIAFLIWFFFKPSEKVNQNAEEKKTTELQQKINDIEADKDKIDYSNIKYSLPNSNYVYDVKIAGIKSNLIKDEFESKADEYSIAEKVDGYILSITLEFTNPYEKEMMAPIPNYYAITSLDKQYFSGSTTYSRSCGCNIDNSTKVEDIKGMELWKLAEGKCGLGSNYCLRFKSGETKKILITFSDPIIITQKKIVFLAFNQKYKKEGSARDRDIGFVLNVDTGKVEGLKYL